MPDVLNVESTVQCPHGGTVNLSTVTGCPFNTGTNPSPCVTVLWLSGAGRASAGALLLNLSSIGLCFNPASIPQGVALISNTQSKVAAQ
jgi:hypothetical protein